MASKCIRIYINIYFDVRLEIMSHQPGGWGYILFLVRIPSALASASTLSFLCIIFWTSQWNLTKLAYIHCWKEGKSWLDFGDIDLIFKVTMALWNVQNMVSSVRLWTSGWFFTKHAKIYCLEKGNSRLDFGDLDLIFKGTLALWNVQSMVSVRYILNQLMGFDHTRIDTLLGEGELLILVTLI